MTANIIIGDALETLQAMPSGSVQTCITSPPYFGLRDYKTGRWEGGDPACDHKPTRGAQGVGQRADRTFTGTLPYRSECGKCGARRVDRQIGLEESVPAYIERLVGVFREVHRVLRADGTLWVNIGDSHVRSPTKGGSGPGAKERATYGEAYGEAQGRRLLTDLPSKNLLGIPWRLAFALQDDGWILRQDVIWQKPNPMPESVEDRFTDAHEYLFLLAKRRRYFFDTYAVHEPCVRVGEPQRFGGEKWEGVEVDKTDPLYRSGSEQWGRDFQTRATRNRRSVWTIPYEPWGGAHFAVFPPGLVEPCILAATSQAGACPTCGAPRRRLVEKKRGVAGGSGRAGRTAEEVNASGKWRADGDEAALGTKANGRVKLGPIISVETIGWEATCRHPEAETSPVPCTVLDPFGGSGTTGMVAERHGRDSILVELNPAFAQAARARIATDLGRVQGAEPEAPFAGLPMFEGLDA